MTRRNDEGTENTAIAYLDWLIDYLREWPDHLDTEENVQQAFFGVWEDTFSDADKAKWKNKLAWAVVNSRKFRPTVYITKTKEGRYYVLESSTSPLLKLGEKQYLERMQKTIARKQKKDPTLDPLRPWVKCHVCKKQTYLGPQHCVKCGAYQPKNGAFLTYRRDVLML